ncbi:N-acetyltransferase, partial [Methylobacterium sp. WL18]
MTVRARIDAAAGTALDGWTGTSRHWAATGDDFVIESLPSDASRVRLTLSRGGDPIAEAELRSGADEAFLALTGSAGRHPADAPVVAALVEAAFQR